MSETTNTTETAGLESVLETPPTTSGTTSRAPLPVTLPAEATSSRSTAQIARQVLSLIVRPGTNTLRSISELDALLGKEDM
ncbi:MULTISPECIES: hypothetical protein [Actinomycetaceae]|uniref:Uncharacterized protein n=1 Tax=Trueperella abortisuis TaxID=445930 RepID=A0ABT9PJE5_9ACTO|nr:MULTISPECIES: hypothetical protein [Actinomycetaceae]MCI7305528.1 hypothetical protein [Trueperella sp.]MCI7456934.1 hypothetical protein [Actinomyces urogenitalis]MDP9832836.1 hypothetical protein [Trueperella abortisuis]